MDGLVKAVEVIVGDIVSLDMLNGIDVAALGTLDGIVDGTLLGKKIESAVLIIVGNDVANIISMGIKLGETVRSSVGTVAVGLIDGSLEGGTVGALEGSIVG